MYVSKGTPPAVINKISKALNAARNDPEVKTRLAESNIEIVPAKRNSKWSKRSFGC
jgi:tripartite-type tricarboxylate transporter receptor subunit TctC